MEDTTGATPPDQTVNTARTVKIGDAEIPEAEVAELLAKRDSLDGDYTRKSQQLATMRKEAEELMERGKQFRDLSEQWQNDPGKRKEIATHLAKEAGLQIGATTPPSDKPSTWDEWTPNEQFLWTQLQETKQANAARDQQFAGILTEFKGFITKSTEDKQLDLDVRAAKKAIKDKYQLEVPVDALREAVAETKILNPEAAWLLKHGPTLQSAALGKGAALQVTDKPNTPGGSSTNTFSAKEFFEKGGNLDDYNNMIADGMVPTELAAK